MQIHVSRVSCNAHPTTPAPSNEVARQTHLAQLFNQYTRLLAVEPQRATTVELLASRQQAYQA
jgi:hypothetical protein